MKSANSKAVREALKKATSDNPFPSRTGNSQFDRISMGIWAARQGREVFYKAREMYREATTFTITVEESDGAYIPIQEWLISTIPQHQQKHVRAVSKTVSLNAAGDVISQPDWGATYGDPDPSNTHATETQIVLSLGDSLDQNIVINGHKVNVTVASRTDPDEANSAYSSGGLRRSGSSSPMRNKHIVFTTRSQTAQQAVVNHLSTIVNNRSTRSPTLWIADSWGGWRIHAVPNRKIESIILRDGLKEDILNDVRKFLKDEERYVKLGIPWHRGYLFHGPAGTGKTSMIKAMAAELGLDLWYAPIGDLKEDSSLVDLVRSVKPRGILLLEDVDSYSAARDRDSGDSDNSDSGISTTALLNVLDGVVTPHGLITIMTTNHIDKLDPALVRSGRADRVIELGYPSYKELRSLWRLFFPKEEWALGSSDEVPGISQAAASEVFKRNWDSPDDAYAELLRLLHG